MGTTVSTNTADLREFGALFEKFAGSPVIDVPPDWTVTSAEVTFEERHRGLYACVDVTYQTPVGQEQKSLILRRPAPAILVVNDEDPFNPLVLVIRQVRHGAGRKTLELPGGMHQRTASGEWETDLQCAVRETAEESGHQLASTDLVPLVTVDRDEARSPGLRAPLFLARRHGQVPAKAPVYEAGEMIDGAFWFPLGLLLEMTARGEITSSVLLSAIAIYLSLPYRTGVQTTAELREPAAA